MPSEDTPAGLKPIVIVCSTVPVLALISLAVFPKMFATQTWAPSEDTPHGPLPTVITFMTAPVRR